MDSGIISYLQKSDMMLDDNNYKAWLSTLRLFFRRLNLWGHVDGTKPTPHLSVASEASSHTTTSGAAFT